MVKNLNINNLLGVKIMGKTYRKDGKNRNKHFVKIKSGNTKKPTNHDYEKMIMEEEEDKKLYEKD